MTTQIKDYLGYENARNKTHAALYTAIVERAFGKQGSCQVMIGHHVAFEFAGDLDTENEIPSADCLMFDHVIMTNVFGADAIRLMQQLAASDCDHRDEILHGAFTRLMAAEVT